MVEEEKKIVEQLENKKPMTMKQNDWKAFKNAVNCHVCNKKLVKDGFLDSLPVWHGVEEEEVDQPQEEFPEDINYEDFDGTFLTNQDY